MRIEFNDKSREAFFKKWFSQNVNPHKYDIYYNINNGDFIAIKNVSTSPKINAVVRRLPNEVAKDICEEFDKEYIPINGFEWRNDTPVQNE